MPIKAILLIGTILLFCSPQYSTAVFFPDDYRYLAQVLDILKKGYAALVDALVVENRWDTQWWITDGSYVRFFRPFVIVSYLFDYLLWGLEVKGYVLTNVILYTLAALLVWGCLAELMQKRRVPFWGALLFAVHGVHSELIFLYAREG